MLKNKVGYGPSMPAVLVPGAWAAPVSAQTQRPRNAEMLQGGTWLEKLLLEQSPPLAADADWSTYGWIRRGYLARSQGERIPPARYSDNHVSLLSGEARAISIAIPGAVQAPPGATVRLRGCNAKPGSLTVASISQ